MLSARLAPDMFPLSTQVRFACVHAREAVCRLRGEAFPAAINELLDEGRHAGERPGTLADAYAPIDETVALLDGLAADALDMDADKPIAHEMTAYSILRSEGINLGKADYVAHMLPYLRRESIPKG